MQNRLITIKIIKFLIIVVFVSIYTEYSRVRGDDDDMNCKNFTIHDIKIEVFWKDSYNLNDKIVLKVILTNASKHSIRFETRKIQSRDWRLFLVDENGTTIPMTEYMKNLDKSGAIGVQGTTWEKGYNREYAHDIKKYYNITKTGKYFATIARRVKFVPGTPHYDERDSVIIKNIPIIVISDKETEKQEKVIEPMNPDNHETTAIIKKKEAGIEFPWIPIVVVVGILIGIVLVISVLRNRK